MVLRQVSPPSPGQLSYARALIERHRYESSVDAIGAVSRAVYGCRPETPAAIVRRAHRSGKQLFTELDKYEISNLIAVLKSPARYGMTTPREMAHTLRLIEANGYVSAKDAIEAVSRAGKDCDPDTPAAIVRRARLSGKILLAELDPKENASLITALSQP